MHMTWCTDLQRIISFQLAAFRNLVDDHGHQLINNFRAIQPLGDRIIRRNIANKKNTYVASNKAVVKDQKSVQSRMAQDVKNIPTPPPKKKVPM